MVKEIWIRILKYSKTLYNSICQKRLSGFGGLVVSMLASGTQVRGFGFFRAKKILSMLSFEREVKPFAPCRRFAAC
jgi:hypothetical protein